MFKQKRDPASSDHKPTVEPADAVQQARTRARQRLIGAVVLLAIGIIGFPLVFETQPRPIPVDVPIEIPRRESLPPLAVPPARVPQRLPDAAAAGGSGAAALATAAAPSATRPTPTPRAADGVITESSADAGRDVSVAAHPAPTERAATERAATERAPAERAAAERSPAEHAPARAVAQASSVVEPHRAASNAVAAAAPAPSASRASGEGERARALLEGRASASAEDQRFVVQVGAFADAEAARETRKHVEKLGLKTYTQVAQTASGNRIRVRVGPFATRGDAEAALAKAKAAGLSAVLLTL